MNEALAPPPPSSLQIESSGVSAELCVAAPLGLVIAAIAVGGIALHTSAATVLVALVALAFAGAVLVSCAYSIWGSCTLVLQGGTYLVIHKLWRWRWKWQFAATRIRSVFVYKPPPAFIMWPGSSGKHIRVSVDRSERSIPIASGLHPKIETLAHIQAMFPNDLSDTK